MHYYEALGVTLHRGSTLTVQLIPRYMYTVLTFRPEYLPVSPVFSYFFKCTSRGGVFGGGGGGGGCVFVHA